jgi:DNA-binding SARP family transcriptional activator
MTDSPSRADRMAGSPARAGQAEAERFPIQPAKVGRPALRDDTLRRDRLLDWLAAKIHHRVVLVVAEAGYGKTTLLADFSRRTRLRSTWFRLDEDDRDPVAFLNYLVAAGRRLDPGFAPTTAAMLSELGTGTIPLDQVTATFMRELGSLGDEGAVLIIDDFHLVDDAPDVRGIVREMLAQAPERLTIVLLTRRRPSLPIARLRALGEVVELGSEELRFLPSETEELFRESYGRPLEPDVLAELSNRTEGWAASLQLVRTALRDRSPAETRAFIRGLSGSHEELHDYLAEEVVGDLPAATQRFLMQTAILQVVEPELAILVTGVSEADLREHVDAGERAGLLGRRGESARRAHGYHPLVRDFLLARLAREIGVSGIRELHRAVARWADGYDWHLATHHFAAASDATDVHRVLAAAIGPIMATGELALAESLLGRFPPPAPIPALEVILSRLDFYRNHIDEAIRRATWAAEASDAATRGPAIINLASLEYLSGRLEAASSRARDLSKEGEEDAHQIARAISSVLESSADGDIPSHLELMRALLAKQLAAHELHFAGISAHNLAIAQIATGHFDDARQSASLAVELLESGTPTPEAAAAKVNWAWALAHAGAWDAADRLLAEAATTTHDLTRLEVRLEAAGLHLWYDSDERADALLSGVETSLGMSTSLRQIHGIVRAELSLRRRRPREARLAIERLLQDSFYTYAGQKSRLKALLARAAAGSADPDADSLLDDAEAHARQQQAALWIDYLALLRGTRGDAARLSQATSEALERSEGLVHMLAEDIAPRLHELKPDVRARLLAAMERRTARWRTTLRTIASSSDTEARLAAARLLDTIGEPRDVRLLRLLVRELRLGGSDALLGRGLARRLADRIVIEDLGRTVVRVGATDIPGADIRRKVLALLLYLVTRQGFSATRDQVLDALWPDHEPTDASNSLNQTLYFLRRVFEERYREDSSPGYVYNRSDVIWLDRELVTSRSDRCRSLLAAASRDRSLDAVDELSREYVAPFALDFSYEDWANSYRETLHAGYLEVVERAVLEDIDRESFDRALELAGRAITVEPTAEALHVLVIRLCRRMGAHAAAAERYEAYSSLVRKDFGVEPRPLEEL